MTITVEEQIIEQEEAQDAQSAKKKDRRERFPAVLCNLQALWDVGGVPVNATVPSDQRYVYVQFFGDGPATSVLNRRGIPPIGGTPVVVGWAEDSYEQEVLEIHNATLPQNYTGPVITTNTNPTDPGFSYPNS